MNEGLTISVKEARKLLGKDAEGMSDDEIINVITTLDLLAKDALEQARIKLRMKKDSKELANVIYDEYQNRKKDL